MPFIRGRYHVNPIAGAALEAAREADEALASLQQAEHGDGAGTADKSNENANTSAAKGPIRRVEIETAEVVPSHSGRGQRGFTAPQVRRLTPRMESRISSARRSRKFRAEVRTRAEAIPAQRPRRTCSRVTRT